MWGCPLFPGKLTSRPRIYARNYFTLFHRICQKPRPLGRGSLFYPENRVRYVLCVATLVNDSAGPSSNTFDDIEVVIGRAERENDRRNSPGDGAFL